MKKKVVSVLLCVAMTATMLLGWRQDRGRRICRPLQGCAVPRG